MKKNLLAIFICFLSYGVLLAQTGWVSQTVPTYYATDLFELDFLNANTGYACGTYGIIIKTTDGGTTWVQQYSNVSLDLTSIRFLDLNTGFSTGGTVPGNVGMILKTTNGGTNWFNIYFGSAQYLSKIRFINSTTAIVSGSDVFLRTTDAGNNWITIPTQTGMTIHSLFMVNENTGYASGVYNMIWGKLLKTTNGGFYWDSLSLGFINNLVGIAFLNANTGYIGSTVYGKYMKTTNGGFNWVIGGSMWNYVDAIYILSQDSIYMAGSADYQNGIAISFTSNGGLNWIGQTQGQVGSLYDIQMVDHNTGYACGQNRKMLKTTNGGLTFITPVSSSMPDDFGLSQNYPNPFNPVTKIKFDIPANVKSQTSNVKLIIYDILGREITTLVNEALKPGSYEAEWPATGGGSNFASGIYFYSLQTEVFTQTKKMVLMK